MTDLKSVSLPDTQLRYFPLVQIGDVSRLPTTVKILLEGVLRAAASGGAAEVDARALATYPAPPPANAAVPFRPSRILLQDYTGVRRQSISPRCARRWSEPARTRRRSNP